MCISKNNGVDTYGEGNECVKREVSCAGVHQAVGEHPPRLAAPRYRRPLQVRAQALWPEQVNRYLMEEHFMVTMDIRDKETFVGGKSSLKWHEIYLNVLFCSVTTLVLRISGNFPLPK